MRPINPLMILLVGTLLPACAIFDGTGPQPGVTTVDLLATLGLEANALAPQVVCADSKRNRVFALCANSSAVAVIDGETDRAVTIPVGVRMPRTLRDQGAAVAPGTGRLFVCAGKELVIVDADAKTAQRIHLPGRFEAVSVDGRTERAYLVGRTSGDLVIVDRSAGTVVTVAYTNPTPTLGFMAASAPPPIRVPFVEGEKGLVHVVDGVNSKLVTMDAATGAVRMSRVLPVGKFPRWHTAGFCPESGRIFAVLESDKRAATHAIAIDVRGTDDAVIDIPEGHTEPAGVSCDAARGEIYIPYDNKKLIHVACFGEKEDLVTVDLPSMGIDATAYDPATRTLYAAGWMQAALYVVDMAQKKRTLTVPFAPVYPHMNSIALNRANGRLYIPSGSTAVNGTFGAALTVFDPATIGFNRVSTGWAPVSLVPRPGSDGFFVYGAEREFAAVGPDGDVTLHRLPHPYAHQSLADPRGERVLVAYGPHSSMWPTFYIGGTHNGIAVIDRDGRVTEDRMTLRLAQAMVFDREGRLWYLQNTWGKEAPFLVCHPGEGDAWFRVPLEPKVDNECLSRLLAVDERTGLLWTVRTGNVSTDPGLVHVVDPDKRAVVATVATGRTPTAIALPRDGTGVYVTNFDDGTVTAIDRTNFETATIPVGNGPLAAAVLEDRGEVVVINHLDVNLAIIAGETVKKVPLPGLELPDNIAVDPSTGSVYITAHCAVGARIYRYDPDSGTVETVHEVSHPFGEVSFNQSNAAFGERAQWGDCIFRITQMAFDSAGRLWIADYLSGQVWIVNV